MTKKKVSSLKKNNKSHKKSEDKPPVKSEPSKEPSKKAPSRIPTGIKGLDEIVQGGFEDNSINLVAGGAGAGKSIFAMQFIIHGIEKYNEPGVYVSFEEKKDPFFKHMKKFGWDLEKLEASKKFAFVEYSPEQVKKMLEEGGGLIESLISKLKAKRLVIDSITAFGLLFQDDLGRRQSTLNLFELIRKWGCTAMLTAEFEPSLETPSTKSVLFEVDSIILLYYIREGDIRKRALEVLKMRGTEHTKKIIPLKITPEGIVVYPHQAVF